MIISNSEPLNLFKISFFVNPNFFQRESTSSSNTISFPFSLSTSAYVKCGFKQIAKLAGIVHGVVVQITKEVSSSNIPLPSRTGNFT